MLRSETLRTGDTISPILQAGYGASTLNTCLEPPVGISLADLAAAITLALDGDTKAKRLWSANLVWQHLDSFNIEKIGSPGIVGLMRLALECEHTRLRKWARLVLRNTFGVEVADEAPR